VLRPGGRLAAFWNVFQFPPGKLEELLAGVGTASDAAGGSFTVGYTSVVVTAARIESA
jgi:hypothetical protein